MINGVCPERSHWKGWAGEKSKNEHVPIRRPKQLWLKSSFPATHLSKPLLREQSDLSGFTGFLPLWVHRCCSGRSPHILLVTDSVDLGLL